MEDYLTLESIFNFFNKKFFDNKLPEAIITLQRKRNCMGYFSPSRFENRTNKKITKDEIAMNPDRFSKGDKEIMQTMAHEMCHMWQHHFGLKKSLKTYHNKEWGNKMEEMGLIPSNTGEIGGKRTGQKMADYIDPKGNFIEIVSGIDKKIIWESRVDLKPKALKDKEKFTCPNCENKAYAKPETNLICGDCKVSMEII
jgi:predicted SprT family Zn-dependent metalloprotease